MKEEIKENSRKTNEENKENLREQLDVYKRQFQKVAILGSIHRSFFIKKIYQQNSQEAPKNGCNCLSIWWVSFDLDQHLSMVIDGGVGFHRFSSGWKFLCANETLESLKEFVLQIVLGAFSKIRQVFWCLLWWRIWWWWRIVHWTNVAVLHLLYLSLIYI